VVKRLKNDLLPRAPDAYSPVLRLLVIPLLVYLAWLIETFLLAGKNGLLQHPEPAGFAIYTLAGCIVTGMVFPIVCIRKAFATGAVNMFQTGFRSLNRTLVTGSVTGAFVMAAILLFNPFGADRMQFARAFLLLLPGATAAAMVCWVLAGTHIQASVRKGGTVLSITSGVVVTGVLFALSVLAANPSLRMEGPLSRPLAAGFFIALFFFAIRDIYATVMVTAAAEVFTVGASLDPAVLQGMPAGIYPSSILVVIALAGIHWWLSRNYATILVRSDPGPAGGNPRDTSVPEQRRKDP